MPVQKNFSPVPEGTLILGADHYYSVDGKKTHLNNNVLVLGRSGSGKTRYFVKSNLLQMLGSYIVTDPKGQLFKEFKQFFKDNGYQVFHVNFRSPSESMHYNPLSKLINSEDIRKMAHAITYASGKKSMSDPYWDLMCTILFSSLIRFMLESLTISKNNISISKLQDLLNLCARDKTLGNARSSERYASPMSLMMLNHKQLMDP